MRFSLVTIAALFLIIGAPHAFAQSASDKTDAAKTDAVTTDAAAAADPETEANQNLGVKPAAPSSDPALAPKAARTPVAKDLQPDDVVVEEIHTQGAPADSKAARNKHQARPTPAVADESAAGSETTPDTAADAPPARDRENEARGSGAISNHDESIHDDAKENSQTVDQATDHMQMKMHPAKESAEATPSAKKPKRAQKTAAAGSTPGSTSASAAKATKKADKKSAAKNAKADKKEVAGTTGAAPNAETVLKWLGNGNTRFVKHHLRADGKTSTDRERLLKGEHPHAAILAAADSRVVPEIVFDQALGEIYDVRGFGENLDSASVAALEYAVAKLKVPLIVVMGNSECAAIKTMLEDKVNENGDHVGDNFTSPDVEKVAADIRPRLKTLKDDPVSPGYEVEATLNADGIARELVKRSDIIREAVEKNQLVIKSALYRLDTGKVSFY